MVQTFGAFTEIALPRTPFAESPNFQGSTDKRQREFTGRRTRADSSSAC
jgi:hypothetical protein